MECVSNFSDIKEGKYYGKKRDPKVPHKEASNSTSKPKNSNIAANRNIPSLQISPADSSDSKVTTKNKCLTQNSYRKGRESYYNEGVSSGYYFLNSQNNSGMLDDINWGKQFSLRTSSGEDSLIIPDVPEITNLIEAHCAAYKQKLLDKVFDYDRILSPSYLEEDSRSEANRTFANQMNRLQQLDFSLLSDEAFASIKAYKTGVGLLKLGWEEEGKQEIKIAADKGLPHARFVYALIIFKEIVKYRMNGKPRRPTQKCINEAIKSMFHIRLEFFPLPSFMLGILLSYDQISISSKLATVFASPHQYFDDVLRGVACNEGNYSIISQRKYIVMEDDSQENLKWIVQSAKYELARELLTCGKGLSDAKSLLQELSSDGCVGAECLYALALLRNEFDDLEYFKKENFEKSFTLLEQAINHGNKHAMFFFGTLPFRQDFKLLDKERQSSKGRYCFDYLGNYIVSCENGEFIKDAAILIAAEYVKGKDSYVTYDEENAKNILRKNGCTYELQNLEKKLKERYEQATNALPGVLDVLELLSSELKMNEEASVQLLSSAVKELLGTLQGSGLYFQQSPLLSVTLKLLCIPDAWEKYFLAIAHSGLHFLLESQLDNESRSSQKVLLSLQRLFLTCLELQKEYYRRKFPEALQYFNENETYALQAERSNNISLKRSEARQDSTPLCSTMKTRGSFSGFVSNSSTINMPTPKVE